MGRSRVAAPPMKDEAFVRELEDRDNPDRSSQALRSGIVIAGAGIGGLATALALHRSGLSSLVLEQADRLRSAGAGLTIWTNASKVLRTLGIYDQCRRDYLNVDRMLIFAKNGTLKKDLDFLTNNSSEWEHDSRCIERGVIVEELAKPLPPGTIRFNSKIVAIRKATDDAESPITVELLDGTTISTKILIGCDGVHSVVAKWLGLPSAKTTGLSAIRGLGEYPEGHNFESGLHQVLGGGVRAGCLPLTVSKVYWFFVYETGQDEANGLGGDRLKEETLNMLHGFPEKFLELVRRSNPDSLAHSHIWVRWIWPLFGSTTLCKGTVAVAGDAMHAMTPDIGQGGCVALEDAVVLARCLAESMDLNQATSSASRNHGVSADGGGSPEAQRRIEEALVQYTKERSDRVRWLQAKSFMISKIMNSNLWFMRAFRDYVALPWLSDASSLLSHTQFDCGPLPRPLCDHLPPQEEDAMGRRSSC